LARRDGARGAGQLDERPRDLPRQQPSEQGGREQRREPRQGHGALDPPDLGVDDRQGRGHPDDGQSGRPAADGDVQTTFVGGRAQAFIASDSVPAAPDRRPDLGARAVVLQLRQRGSVEFGVAPDLACGIDQRDTVTDPLPQRACGIGPGERVAREQQRHELGLTLEAVSDLLYQVTAQQPIRGDDQPADGHGQKQAGRDEQAGDELHARLRLPTSPVPRASGRRKR